MPEVFYNTVLTLVNPQTEYDSGDKIEKKAEIQAPDSSVFLLSSLLRGVILLEKKK